MFLTGQKHKIVQTYTFYRLVMIVYQCPSNSLSFKIEKFQTISFHWKRNSNTFIYHFNYDSKIIKGLSRLVFSHKFKL